VILQKCGKRYPVDYTGSYDLAKKIYTLTLLKPLDFLTDYTITTTTGVKTTDGVEGGYDSITNFKSSFGELSISSGQFVDARNINLVSYNAIVSNNTANVRKATIVICQVGANGSLKASSGANNPAIAANSTGNINANLTLKNYAATDKVYVYLWDDFKSMNSYSYGAVLN